MKLLPFGVKPKLELEIYSIPSFFITAYSISIDSSSEGRLKESRGLFAIDII